MDILRLSGLLIILGFIVFWVGNIYSPPNVYSETDIQVRLDVVEANQARWAVSQGLGVVGIGIVLLGLLLVSLNGTTDYPFWSTILPAGLNILGLILAVIWLTGYINDPAASWQNAGFSILTVSAVAILTGGILYGLLFSQMGLPSWIAYLAIGYCAIALLALIVANPPAFWVISFYLLILLAAAVALIRSP